MLKLTGDLNVDIEKASFNHFEHQSHFGSSSNPIKITFFSMRVHCNVVAECTFDQQKTDDQLPKKRRLQRFHAL